MRENQFQSQLIRKIKERFPDAIVLKNDSSYIQGIPDLTVLWKDKWAALECKKSAKEHHQPNQDYYVDKLNEMSYSSFIFPENEQEVLDGMEKAFRRVSGNRTRNVRSQ